MHQKLPGMCALLVLLCGSSPAWAQDNDAPLWCAEPSTWTSAPEYLRALSLDLRGKLPSPGEYEALETVSDVPDSLIDEWLASPEFGARLVRFHRSILWNNLSNIGLFQGRATLRENGDIYWRRDLGDLYRGEDVRCLDEEATFTAAGEIVTTEITENNGMVTQREGWVWVAPYWAPDTLIKVCAFDAQEEAVGPTGASCDRPAGYQDAGCGCGPNLQWCAWKSNEAVSEALEQDLNRRVLWLLENNRPYTDLLTQAPAFVNGPLAHFLKHQVFVHNTVSLEPSPVPVQQIPDIPYTEVDTWVEIPVGSQHAGILTSPAFLLRFQTNRARASKYYADFLCSPFQPPPGGLPPSTDEEALEVDLQKRAGCKLCHSLLEPAASHWGRWPEQGGGYLNPEEYTPYREDCALCAVNGGCSQLCRDRYVTEAIAHSEKAYFGWLQAYLFRRPEHKIFVEEGPRLLVESTMVDDRLPSCVTAKMSRWLLGRPALAEEEGWLADVAMQFVANGYDVRALVKAIVTSDMYRNVR